MRREFVEQKTIRAGLSPFLRPIALIGTVGLAVILFAYAMSGESDAPRERLGEHLVRAKMLTYGHLDTKPLRFSTGLRFDTTGQHTRVQKVMSRHHFSRTPLHRTTDRFSNRWVSETDERRLDDMRGHLAA